jgi:hypothetical protein
MQEKQDEIWKTLASLEHKSITPYEDYGSLELAAILGRDPASILKLTEVCSNSCNPGLVAVCAFRLAQYQNESRYSRCLLPAWVLLTPAIVRTWRERPESMSTALSAIEAEFRASYALGPLQYVDCHPLGLLVEESLIPRDLPRLRDDIYLSAVSLVGFLLKHSWISRMFTARERQLLPSKISALLPWLRSHGYSKKDGGIVSAYEEEIAAAEHIIEALSA